jgi:lipopolysaccharide export system ATP-binding protein
LLEQPIKNSFQTLRGENLKKSFGKRKILKGVDCTINVGEAVGLLGPNGAGKTTFFLLLTGLSSPNHGKVFLDDQDITYLPMYRRARLGIRYLPQESSVFRGINVEENILAVLEVLEPNKQARQEELESLLEEFHLTHLRKSATLSLSGGERRRVEIARALVGRPSFLLLDEPLAGIDPKSMDEVRGLIAKVKEKNVGVLLTDHNVFEAFRMIDRAYVIYDGAILKEGTPLALSQDEEVRRVYLGNSFDHSRHFG